MGLNRRTLSGSPEVEWVEADGLKLVIDMSAAAPQAAGSDARPFRVPVFAAGRVALRHADIEVIDPDGLGILSCEMSPSTRREAHRVASRDRSRCTAA